MQMVRLAFVALSFVCTTLLPPAARAATDTFVATLVGNEETPPNASTSTGHATFTLNADDTLTYTVTSTGFVTSYRVAHVHTGGSAWRVRSSSHQLHLRRDVVRRDLAAAQRG